MIVAASQVFGFLEQCPTCSIEKHEIHLGAFSVLRRSIRLIVIRLNEDGDDESQEIADRFRTLLSEWLTVPVPFDDSFLESISAVGDADAIDRRWGHEVRTAYDHTCGAARLLQRAENPARGEVRNAVRQLGSLGSTLKIYCHRRARAHFESIFADDPLPPDVFLHSVKDYREVEPFDCLIKVGALRSKGWGSAPDAVLSAPRFAKMVQIVWSGCSDEDDFGYDPAGITGTSGSAPSGAADPGGARAIRWRRDVIKIGDAADIAAATADDDELKLFRALALATAVRRATLVEIDSKDGILYPPHSAVALLHEYPVGVGSRVVGRLWP